MQPFVLSEQTYAAIRQTKWDAAVLPFGATEPHNLHMPYGTDNYQVDEIGRRACAFAWQRGARVLLLPTIPFGVNTNHLQVPSGHAISLMPTTLLKILGDVCESLEAAGVRKLVLLNGHGGNELKPFMRELHNRTKIFLCLCDWFRMAPDEVRKICENPGEHADELETSLGMAFFPQLLDKPVPGSGTGRPARLEAVRKGWISITRPWHLLTSDTGVGDPGKATAEKGRAIMQILEEQIGKFLVELAKAEMDAMFPY
ncbi:MAG: creatininase family protein [Tepidisphaerales bacterium]